MEFGFSTLEDAARVILTLGCRMGDATLGDVGRTLGVLLGCCSCKAGGIEGLWMGVGGSCRGVLVVQCAVVWRIGGVTLVMVLDSSHQLKRSRRVEIARSWASLVVEGALVMALEMASRLWTMVSAGMTVRMVR
jgi:hypothetical protein